MGVRGKGWGVWFWVERKNLGFTYGDRVRKLSPGRRLRRLESQSLGSWCRNYRKSWCRRSTRPCLRSDVSSGFLLPFHEDREMTYRSGWLIGGHR